MSLSVGTLDRVTDGTLPQTPSLSSCVCRHLTDAAFGLCRHTRLVRDGPRETAPTSSGLLVDPAWGCSWQWGPSECVSVFHRAAS